MDYILHFYMTLLDIDNIKYRLFLAIKKRNIKARLAMLIRKRDIDLWLLGK